MKKYNFEEIKLADIEFQDNIEVLNLVEEKIGIICILNKEYYYPKENNIIFISKLKTINKSLIYINYINLQ